MGDSPSSTGELLIQSKSLLRYQTRGLNQLVSLSLRHSHTFPVFSMSLQTLVPLPSSVIRGEAVKQTKKQNVKQIVSLYSF